MDIGECIMIEALYLISLCCGEQGCRRHSIDSPVHQRQFGFATSTTWSSPPDDRTMRDSEWKAQRRALLERGVSLHPTSERCVRDKCDF